MAPFTSRTSAPLLSLAKSCAAITDSGVFLGKPAHADRYGSERVLTRSVSVGTGCHETLPRTNAWGYMAVPQWPQSMRIQNERIPENVLSTRSERIRFSAAQRDRLSTPDVEKYMRVWMFGAVPLLSCFFPIYMPGPSRTRTGPASLRTSR